MDGANILTELTKISRGSRICISKARAKICIHGDEFKMAIFHFAIVRAGITSRIKGNNCIELLNRQ